MKQILTILIFLCVVGCVKTTRPNEINGKPVYLLNMDKTLKELYPNGVETGSTCYATWDYASCTARVVEGAKEAHVSMTCESEYLASCKIERIVENNR